jgi:hypothetical protein
MMGLEEAPSLGESSINDTISELVPPFIEYRRFSLLPKIIERGLQFEVTLLNAQSDTLDVGLNLNKY